MELLMKDGTPFLIRPATDEDAQSLIDYLNQIGGESDFLLAGANEFRISVEEEKKFLREMNENPNNLFRIAQCGGEIAGVVSLKALSSKRVAHNCELGVSVRKKYWHQGVGTVLMEAAIDYARTSGTLKVIHLMVFSSNVNAIALYQKLGFVTVGVNKDYIKINGSYQDAVLMNLAL